jgi:hypothetical protein
MEDFVFFRCAVLTFLTVCGGQVMAVRAILYTWSRAAAEPLYL